MSEKWKVCSAAGTRVSAPWEEDLFLTSLIKIHSDIPLSNSAVPEVVKHWHFLCPSGTHTDIERTLLHLYVTPHLCEWWWLHIITLAQHKVILPLRGHKHVSHSWVRRAVHPAQPAQHQWWWWWWCSQREKGLILPLYVLLHWAK